MGLCRNEENDQTSQSKLLPRQIGDAYTFVGIERNTKLVLAWHLGDRDAPNTEAFTEKLDRATSGYFQLTTDGMHAYPDAISYSLGTRVDYAQLIKVYAQGSRSSKVSKSIRHLRW